jgi:hypothetical protein
MTYLEVAIAEAERFLERAKALQKWRSTCKKEEWRADDPTLSASMKRSSLDLSKALPVLRKSRYKQTPWKP